MNAMSYKYPSTAEPCQLLIMNANQRDSPFLRLPLELREIIYEYTFMDSKITVAHSRPSKSPVSARPKYLCEGFRLLQACAQIRREAPPYFYSNCVFDLSLITFWSWGSPDVVRDIQLITISESNARLMGKRLEVNDSPRKDWDVEKCSIGAFRSLRRVYVDCRMSTQQHTDMGPSPSTERLRLCFDKDHLEVVFIRAAST
ncbi:hypothetical protein BDU57DRAFT_510840 [Ampelomyces quisqualis]|uniref:F-box domain-containing protein n=1 Tax=Ampelomyces quisqualis TaxID=50730 RepID=A0A6A5R3T0_AMPQU|nr:hypothetical protein BDU57DRAFT_510840 [Ampelomyces quisqualis]